MTFRRIILALLFSVCYAIPAISEDRVTVPAEINIPLGESKPVDSSEPAKPSLKPEDSEPLKDNKTPAFENHTASVKSSQKAGNYIYLQVEEDGKELWIATMPSMLKPSASPGDKVEYSNAITMKDFKSVAMGRTFDTILFVTKIRVLDKEMPTDEYHKIAPVEEKPVKAPLAGEIEKASDGKTVAELFAEHESLKDKEVTIRAMVMKVKKNILKKTWLTLQDGTGSAPDDLLHATTLEDTRPGDIVLVKGILRTDIDLGGQYKYKILLEETTILNK